MKSLLIFVLILGVSVSVGFFNKKKTWGDDHRRNKKAFVSTHESVESVHDSFAKVNDMAGELIMRTFIDRLVNEVNMLESRIENQKWYVLHWQERLNEGKYHTDECEYQNSDWVANPRICREHYNYLLHEDWKFGKPLTKEGVKDKIREHLGVIEESLERIKKAKVEAVELDKQIKAGLRDRHAIEGKKELDAMRESDEKSKEWGVKAFDSRQAGLDQIEYK